MPARAALTQTKRPGAPTATPGPAAITLESHERHELSPPPSIGQVDRLGADVPPLAAVEGPPALFALLLAIAALDWK